MIYTVSIEDRTDHLGNIFDSRSKMCKHWGVNNATYNTRINVGMTKEEALTTPVRCTSIEDRIDHLGNVFDSMTKMCEYYGLTRSIYQGRIKNGWSKEKALTIPINIISDESNRTDHLGNVFKSKKEMCKFYNITANGYDQRIKKGMSKEEALTTKKATCSDKEDRTDHLGQLFDSLNQMCEHWGIGKNKYLNRIRSGWSKEKALTSKEDMSVRADLEDRTDHLGQVFDSLNQMCEHWGVNPRTYKNRIRRGKWTKEKALTYSNQSITKIEDRTDHLGNIFETQGEMCKEYNIDHNTYLGRLRDYHSKEEALGIVPLLDRRIKNTQFTDEITVIRFVYRTDNLRYYECEVNGSKEILSSDDILEAYRKTLKKETE